MFWMPLQLVMGFRQVGTSIVLGMLLFSLLGASWEEQEPVRRLLSGSEVDGAIEDNLADLLWVNCELELSSLKEVYEDLDVNIQDTFSIPDSNTPKEKASSEENVQRALSFQKVLMVLDPLIRKKLLDCVGEKIGNFPVPGEEVAPTSWYLKHLGSLFSKFYAPTTSIRRLASASGHAFTPAPTPSPEPALRHAQSRSPPLHPLLEAYSPVTPFFPSVAPPTNSGSQAKSSDQGSTHRTLIVAVVVSASVTIIVASLTFLCCRFTCCKGSRFKDDKPLLNVNMSDYSVGSSVKSYVRDNSFKKLDTNFSEKNGATSSDGGAISAKANASANNVSQISAGFFGESVNANANVPSLLKPPPGRIGVFPPGMPPLKPPPGRADPLPPERPASMRSMPSRTGPPLPSPVPPPSRPAGAAVPPAPRPPPPPPVPSRSKPSPSPPPPPRAGGPPPPPRAGGPPPPPRAGAGPPRPSGTGAKASSSSSTDDANKAKLKPFFWDKVMANPDHSMVWDQIKSGSFQFNEEMIETLFGYAPVEKNKNEQNRGSNSHNQQSQFIQLIDPKKAQNLSILLRALNVTTEEVIDALKEGKELPSELLETLMRMAPTTDEELKLRLYSGELSQLGPAERFLKVLVDIPFAFKRLESLFFMGTVQEEVTVVRDSLLTLEAACKEVKSSRLFLKLLEAVLKTGNRMNDGTFRGGAQAFKLDTLLKLSDVKGTDGKTTLLHFVVEEIIRSEGLRAVREAKESQSLSSIKSDDLLEDPSVEDAEEQYCILGLQAVSGLGSQLENVKKAACLDANSLIGTIAKLGSSLVKTKNFLNSEMKGVDMDSGFCKVLKAFVENVESEIIWWLEEEKRIMGMVKKTADYFHGNAGKDEGLRLFVIVRDFLIMLDKVCREVREKAKRTARKEPREKDAPARRGSSETPRQLPSPNISRKLFPAIMDRRVGDSSSSDDED